MIIYPFLIILLVLLPVTVTAADKPAPIQFFYLSSSDPTENSVLSGECTGDTSYPEVDCKFTQIRVRQEVKSEDIPQKMKELDESLNAVKKDFPKYTKEFCKDMKEEEISKTIVELKKSKAFETATLLQDNLSFCKNPTYSKLEDLLKKMITHESKTCKISTFGPTTTSFKKIAPNRWVSNEGPTGLCNSVIVTTLEKEPSYSSLWTYTQTRAYADQNNDLCRGLEVNKPLIYTWKASKQIELKCEFIGFGF